MRKEGKEKNGMEWNGMEWNGMEGYLVKVFESFLIDAIGEVDLAELFQ